MCVWIGFVATYMYHVHLVRIMMETSHKPQPSPFGMFENPTSSGINHLPSSKPT